MAAMRWILASTLILFGAAPALAQSALDYVKPMIGTDEHGHVFPGATLPFGMVQLSPDTREGTWDGSSGYHYSDKTILGFSHNHLSGTGVPDLGYILLMPTVGDLKMTVGKSPADGYQQRFTHDQETATPGYYRVNFPDSQIQVELTATTRAGMHRYTFPQSDHSHVILDLVHGISSNPNQARITIEDDHTVAGYRRAGGWGGEKTFFFVAQFSKPFKGFGLENDGKPADGKELEDKRVRAHFDFQTQAGEKILVRVALSTVSVDGARKNLQAEMPGWDFDGVAAAARKQWDVALSSVHIESPDPKTRDIFYTALYHTMMAPTVLSDVDGQVRGPDGKVHQVDGFDYYTELSLWDTFRAENPLLTLTQPQRINDIIKTMLAHFKFYNHNVLPIWPDGGKETNCMIGNHAIPIITEAYAKGFHDWDAKEALADMIASVSGPQNFQDKYRQMGYIPVRPSAGTPTATGPAARRDPQRQATSRTLEYAYDDACIARLAQMLNDPDTAATYLKRSENWKNVFDPATGFMRGKREDGSWLEPFDPTRVEFDSFTEANAWHYTFFVPQNVHGLIQAMGGDDKFAAKLDECFDSKGKMTDAISDITGDIGMYAHGNEPCHHYAFLFNYAGRADRTQFRTRQVATRLYEDTPAGLCGNDDCGQTSAWYVFAVLGFYPVDPASGVYIIGSPLVDKATLNLDSKYYPGARFTISTEHNSPENLYIQSATLNGKPLTHTWITHAQIAQGGELHFVMGNIPNPAWGKPADDRP